MPSCSTSTPLTCSATSSLDAAMSPHSLSWVKCCLFRRQSGFARLAARGAARRSYRLGPLRQTRFEPPADVVLDTARREADRVRDRTRGRVAVRDHGEPAQTEEIRAAVGVGIEAAE